MAENEPSRPGILESLRGLCDTGLAAIFNRVELFAVELEEQKARMVRLLVLGAIAVFVGNSALMLIAATLVFVVGEETRVPLLIGLSVLLVAAAVAAFLRLRHELRNAPPPFEGTLSELKKDRDWLHSRK